MNNLIPANQWINLFWPIVFAFFFSIFWLFAFTKKLLFWLWLWQLKDYHWWRFLDHFRTHKGRGLVFNYLNLAKFAYLGLSIIAYPLFSYVLLFILAGESIIAFRRGLKGKLIKPKATKKTILIVFLGIFFQGLLLFGLRALFGYGKYFVLLLALIDLAAPVVLSLFIMSFQPLIVFLRNKTLEKAKRKRKRFSKLQTIGITGSYGKSSTKEFLAHLLSSQHEVLKTEKNINAEIGVAQTILNKLEQKHRFFICEMGAYRKGGIKLLCEIAQPETAILTGINQQHLATFGSQGNIIETKFELIDFLAPNSTAVVNADNKIIRRELENRAVLIKEKNLKIIYCSVKELDNFKIEKEKISFSWQGQKFETGLTGGQNAINLLMALKCAKELGMDLEKMSQAVKKIKPFRKTMELKKGFGQITIIDDTYSANPEGVMAAIKHLNLFEGSKIIVMPCLIELGLASKEAHRLIGEQIGRICDLAIITSRDCFKEIRQGALGQGMKRENIVFIEGPEKIFNRLRPYLKPDNVILLESRIPQDLFNLLKCCVQ